MFLQQFRASPERGRATRTTGRVARSWACRNPLRRPVFGGRPRCGLLNSPRPTREPRLSRTEPIVSTAAPPSPGKNEKILFWASFFTLIAAGIGFSIRTDIIAYWGKDFGFTQTELGQLTGMGLAGFGVAIIFFSFFTDLF